MILRRQTLSHAKRMSKLVNLSKVQWLFFVERGLQEAWNLSGALNKNFCLTCDVLPACLKPQCTETHGAIQLADETVSSCVASFS